ncbi:MAG: tetratricopeptide repeat protein [Candidatus Falkowbacteria bacterium]|nr:tetratricopeptide repeat protein [Candidatus Falkowbacteria bacterium]
MLVYLSLILVLVCLLIIFFVVFKKFTTLALLDLEHLPGRKEAKFKNQIIAKRLDRDLDKISGSFSVVKNFFERRFGSFLHQLRLRLEHSKERYSREKKLTLSERRAKVAAWFSEAKEAAKKGDSEKAEELLISTITLDHRYLPAFIELGDTYFELRKYLEAKQTFLHVLKVLSRKTVSEFANYRSKKEIYFSLAQTNKQLDDFEDAIDNLHEALEIEANNPRYLDLILELSIMKKDCVLAESVLSRLEEVNPENKKLKEFRSRLEKIK